MEHNKRKFVVMTSKECEDKKRKIMQLQADVAEHERRMNASIIAHTWVPVPNMPVSAKGSETTDPIAIPTRIEVVKGDDGWETRSLMKGEETRASIQYRESLQWCGRGDHRRRRWHVYMLVPKGSRGEVKILLESLKEYLNFPVLIQTELVGPEDEEEDELLIYQYGDMLESLDFKRDAEEYTCYHNNVYVPP